MNIWNTEDYCLLECDKGNDVSDEPAVSIFRVEALSLKMQTACSSETLLLSNGAQLPEGTDLEIKPRGNLKFSAIAFAQFIDTQTDR
jgi:hypothetical protein